MCMWVCARAFTNKSIQFTLFLCNLYYFLLYVYTHTHTFFFYKYFILCQYRTIIIYIEIDCYVKILYHWTYYYTSALMSIKFSNVKKIEINAIARK